MADEVLVAPIVRPTSTGLRCARAILYIEIPEVDGQGNVTGTFNVELDLADPTIPGPARQQVADVVRAIAQFKGAIQ
jgi:hypothetical protein